MRMQSFTFLGGAMIVAGSAHAQFTSPSSPKTSGVTARFFGSVMSYHALGTADNLVPRGVEFDDAWGGVAIGYDFGAVNTTSARFDDFTVNLRTDLELGFEAADFAVDDTASEMSMAT